MLIFLRRLKVVFAVQSDQTRDLEREFSKIRDEVNI